MIVGIVALIFSAQDYELDSSKAFLGWAMLLSGIPYLFIYIIEKGFKNFNKSSYFIFGLVSLCMGIVFMTGEISIELIWVIWGIFDIIRGAFELRDIIPETKENKLEILEMVAIIGDIVLGILLCAHLKHGIPVHLIYMGLSYFMISTKKILDIALFKEENKE